MACVASPKSSSAAVEVQHPRGEPILSQHVDEPAEAPTEG